MCGGGGGCSIWAPSLLDIDGGGFNPLFMATPLPLSVALSGVEADVVVVTLAIL